MRRAVPVAVARVPPARAGCVTGGLWAAGIFLLFLPTIHGRPCAETRAFACRDRRTRCLAITAFSIASCSSICRRARNSTSASRTSSDRLRGTRPFRASVPYAIIGGLAEQSPELIGELTAGQRALLDGLLR